MSMVCGMSETDGKFCLILRSSSYPFLRSSNLIRSEMRSTFGFAFFFFFCSVHTSRPGLIIRFALRSLGSFLCYLNLGSHHHTHPYIHRPVRICNTDLRIRSISSPFSFSNQITNQGFLSLSLFYVKKEKMQSIQAKRRSRISSHPNRVEGIDRFRSGTQA